MENDPSFVRSSAVKVYYDKTGYLPPLKKQLNAPVSSTMYGEGWMSEQDVREYMEMRNFGSESELAMRTFDYRHTADEQFKRIGELSLTTGEHEFYTGEKPNQPSNKVSDPRRGDLTADRGIGFVSGVVKDPKMPGELKSGVVQDLNMGKDRGSVMGLGMIGITVIFAIGYLIFARGK